MNKYKTSKKIIKVGPFSYETTKISKEQRKSDSKPNASFTVKKALIILVIGLVGAYVLEIPGTEYINAEKVSIMVELLKVIIA